MGSAKVIFFSRRWRFPEQGISDNRHMCVCVFLCICVCVGLQTLHLSLFREFNYLCIFYFSCAFFKNKIHLITSLFIHLFSCSIVDFYLVVYLFVYVYIYIYIHIGLLVHVFTFFFSFIHVLSTLVGGVRRN